MSPWVLRSSLSKKRGCWNHGNWVNKSSEAQEITCRTQKIYITSWNPSGISLLIRKLNDRNHRHTVHTDVLSPGFIASLDHAEGTSHPCTRRSCAVDSASSVGDLFHHIIVFQLTAFSQKCSKACCCKLNHYLLFYSPSTWRTASFVYWKAAVTLVSSF